MSGYVLFALRETLEKQLKRLGNNGIIYPVTKTVWASAMAAVPKSFKKAQGCGILIKL